MGILIELLQPLVGSRFDAHGQPLRLAHLRVHRALLALVEFAELFFNLFLKTPDFLPGNFPQEGVAADDIPDLDQVLMRPFQRITSLRLTLQQLGQARLGCIGAHAQRLVKPTKAMGIF